MAKKGQKFKCYSEEFKLKAKICIKKEGCPLKQ